MLNMVVGIGRIISTIKTHDIAIIGMFENLGYLTLLIIKTEIMALSNHAK